MSRADWQGVSTVAYVKQIHLTGGVLDLAYVYTFMYFFFVTIYKI